MTKDFNRRQVAFGLTGVAFGGMALYAGALSALGGKDARAAGLKSNGYGPLQSDPNGLLDLPRGFSYRILSSHGDRMSDGLIVPDHCDGMGCFALGDGRIALVRNHELRAKALKKGAGSPAGAQPGDSYDRLSSGAALPGGTSTLIVDAASLKVEEQYLSLAGTIRNCAGGITPWGSWLTCEEDVSRAGEDGLSQDHGWVFEVPAAHRGLVHPVPLKAMGRFNHEAACVDPATGIVYMTEDRDDSLLYRFLPHERGALAKGGRLQALALSNTPADTRNWGTEDFTPGTWANARWIDLDAVDSPDDDLRLRGARAGAALFARGEGIWFGQGEFYFCCTSGGKSGLGQIMRYRPSSVEGMAGERDEPGRLQIFVESHDKAMFNYGDNLTVGPNGHLIVCEDQYTHIVNNHLRGVTPDGALYTLGRLRLQGELAGACFSPDGSTLFVNIYSPGKTLAIRGPW